VAIAARVFRRSRLWTTGQLRAADFEPPDVDEPPDDFGFVPADAGVDALGPADPDDPDESDDPPGADPPAEPFELAEPEDSDVLDVEPESPDLESRD
jgi:hypothetical protein